MTALIADPISKDHDTGPGHPESPKRFDAALNALDGLGLRRLASRAATEDELALCHSRPYIQTAEREVNAGHHELSTGDTVISARSFEVACVAAGSVMNAVDHVFKGEARNVF